MAREPEDQLVQKQYQGVVAERLRVSGHDAQAFIERHEALAVCRVNGTRRGEEGIDQVADQTQAFVVAGRCFEGRVESGRIPTAPERAPGSRRSSSVSTAMKWLLPLPKLPCR